jgi:5-methylcytosine-specific restriction protein A
MAPTINRLRDQRKRRPIYYNQSSEYYGTRQWHDLRDHYIQHHPLCERCLEQGRTVPAEHVHHVIPFLTGNTKADRMKLLLDEDNLMSLCRSCHKAIHRELDAAK